LPNYKLIKPSDDDEEESDDDDAGLTCNVRTCGLCA
jgi:hypothetical protein